MVPFSKPKAISFFWSDDQGWYINVVSDIHDPVTTISLFSDVNLPSIVLSQTSIMSDILLNSECSNDTDTQEKSQDQGRARLRLVSTSSNIIQLYLIWAPPFWWDFCKCTFHTKNQILKKIGIGRWLFKSIFILGRIYRWLSRAKVAAWFRSAFFSSSSDSSSNSTNNNRRAMSVRKMREIRNHTSCGGPKPKIFYVLPKRDTQLTLEDDLKVRRRFNFIWLS